MTTLSKDISSLFNSYASSGTICARALEILNKIIKQVVNQQMDFSSVNFNPLANFEYQPEKNIKIIVNLSIITKKAILAVFWQIFSVAYWLNLLLKWVTFIFKIVSRILSFAWVDTTFRCVASATLSNAKSEHRFLHFLYIQCLLSWFLNFQVTTFLLIKIINLLIIIHFCLFLYIC